MHTNLIYNTMIAQILFTLVLAGFSFFIYKRVKSIADTIHLGRDLEVSGSASQRWSNMLLLALGQKKMFDKPLIGVLHLAVYVGFILINVELLEILVDGIFGTHRFLFGVLGKLYSPLISFFEILAFLVIVACVVFLIRRNVLKVPRLNLDRHLEMRGWPSLDANIILLVEILLMLAFLTMNAADSILQERSFGHFGEAKTGSFLVSGIFNYSLSSFSDHSLFIIERACWWFHIVGILAFALYMTYSKHLHIVLAFPNAYFASLKPKGQMSNMPAVAKEVKIMLGLEPDAGQSASPEKFGAKDVQDLTWKNLMDAYSCTECGRCTSQCPANLTGKLLSPRKIMMSTRDRLEDISNDWNKNGKEYKDEKSLLGDYITDEEILACTSCNACVEACPVSINPLDIILQLRRYRVMEESKAPGSWNGMFQNLETSMSPWKFSPDQRMDWTNA
jgi:heterodisulfide reductase subunit C